MAIQFIQKKNAGTAGTPTAILNDTAGRALLPNFDKASGFAYDTATGELKYNDAGTIRPLFNGKAEVVTATRAVLISENGRTFFLNSATEFVTTLPAPTLNLHYRFIVTGAPSGASYTIVSAGAAEVIVGSVHSAQATSADTETTAGATTITFVDGQSVIGDWCEIVSDGTNWYAQVFVAVTAGATFTG